MHRGAFWQSSFRWIYYYGGNKSTGKETGKSHLCAMVKHSISFENNQKWTLWALKRSGTLWYIPAGILAMKFDGSNLKMWLQNFFTPFNGPDGRTDRAFVPLTYSLSFPPLFFKPAAACSPSKMTWILGGHQQWQIDFDTS